MRRLIYDSDPVAVGGQPYTVSVRMETTLTGTATMNHTAEKVKVATVKDNSSRGENEIRSLHLMKAHW